MGYWANAMPTIREGPRHRQGPRRIGVSERRGRGSAGSAGEAADPGGLALGEIGVEEGVGRDPLEADIPLRVDEKRPVQGLALEVVEAAVCLEDLQAGIGQQ